jgi:putative nucleotidyltransferase with HDIG domain
MQNFSVKEKKTWKERLKENDLGWRLLVGFICFFCLTVFLHFREIKVETLELNTIANRYVVAQVDFEFPDNERMFVLKQEVIAGIGPIYKIDEKALRQIHYDFEYFLVQDRSWRLKFPNVGIEEMYKASDAMKEVLGKVRFIDAVTKRNLKKYNVPEEDFYLISLKEKTKDLKLSLDYWKNDVLEEALSEKLPNIKKNIINFIVSFFKDKPYPLVEDFRREEEVENYIINTVPQKYTAVKAGSKIIGQGEKVLEKHITMLQSMKEALGKKKLLWSPFIIIGNLLMALIFVILSYLYLRIDQKEILRSLQKLSLFVCIIILTLAFAKISEYVILQNASTLLEAIRYPLIVPFAAILLLMLFNSRIALYGASFLAIILAITLAVDHNRFLILNLIASLVVIVTTKSLRKRKEVFEVCGKCLIGALGVILAFNFVSFNFGIKYILTDIAFSVIFMLVIAILVVGILPILESMFNVMTDITIMEYMDPNNELLKRLTLEMPGTYQHSLVLGNLAEIAAQSIGANGLLCRVATLYHDIGKLTNANFFTENQQQGVDIHQLLTPVESAQVIISHVKDGVILARKYKLPQAFIDIIQEHHGTTLVYFFYRKELELKGGDPLKVDESKFRYPGPKPHSKESAIIMISDGIEAISRSEGEFTEKSLAAVVDKVVKERADDGQFDECNLTFQEIKIIKKTLIQTLIATRHVRIKYPEKKD